MVISNVMAKKRNVRIANCAMDWITTIVGGERGGGGGVGGCSYDSVTARAINGS